MKHKHGGAHHHGRGLASHIMQNPNMTPAGFTTDAAGEQADRMGQRAARGGAMPPPGGGAFGLAPGAGGGPGGGQPIEPASTGARPPEVGNDSGL